MTHRLTTFLSLCISAIPFCALATTETSSTTSQLSCTVSTITPYVNLCATAWETAGSSPTISSSTTSYATSNTTSLAVCYNHNLCECVSALYPAFNISLAQTCSMAVANAYFTGIQSTNVQTATSTPSDPILLLQQAMTQAFVS